MDVKTINNIEKAPTAKPGKLSHKKKEKRFWMPEKEHRGVNPLFVVSPRRTKYTRA